LPRAPLVQSDREALGSLLDEAISLLNDTAEISERDRISLLGLIIACRSTLARIDVAGAATFRTQVAELSLTLATVGAGVHDEAKRAKFTDVARSLWFKVGVVATTAGLTELTTEGIRAITGAS
jgi:hypothetical protein